MLIVIGIVALILIINLSFIYMYNPSIVGSVVEQESEERIVTKIIDGDTIIVEGGDSVRLLGIDCDERGKQCYTPAKNRIEESLLNKRVTLVKSGEDKDQYDRKLRYILLEGENINVKMVGEGYCVARFVGDQELYKKEIQEAESLAISNRIGCKWGIN